MQNYLKLAEPSNYGIAPVALLYTLLNCLRPWKGTLP